MAISNTIITIKRSSATSRPTSLNPGELAYSYLSNTMFVGSSTGAVLNVGGIFYTSQIDNATSANVASTLVKRDASGAFAGRLFGNSNTATALETARTIAIGGAGEITATGVAFDGTGNITLSANLNNSGVTAQTIGSGTVIPQITVDAHGRITNIQPITNPGGGGVSAVSFGFSNTASGTPLVTVYGGNTVNLFGASGGGISTLLSGSNGVSFAVDSTVARTGTGQTFTGNQTFSNDVSISGNLTVLGTTTTIKTSSLDIGDSLIYLANNNLTSDIVDIGIIGHYNDGANAHAGIFRDPNLKEWIFFKGYTPEVQSNNLINIADPSFAYANVYASYLKGNVIGTTASFTGAVSGGTFSGAGTGLTGTATGLTANISLYSSTTEATTGTLYPKFGNALSGNLADIANNAISLNASTGTLTVKSLTLNTPLAVGSGGTGATTFTTNGILFGNGGSAIGATALAGSADQTYTNQILTVTNAGVPVWANTMDGGTF